MTLPIFFFGRLMEMSHISAENPCLSRLIDDLYFNLEDYCRSVFNLGAVTFSSVRTLMISFQFYLSSLGGAL